MGHLKPAIKRKQRNVYNPICPKCGMELAEVVYTNSQANRAVDAHIKRDHHSIADELKRLEY